MSLVRSERNKNNRYTYVFSEDTLLELNHLLYLIGYNVRKSESKTDPNPPLQDKPQQRQKLLAQLFNATLTDELSNEKRFNVVWGNKSSTKRKEKILQLLWSFIERGKGTNRSAALKCWEADMTWVEGHCNPKLSKNKRNLKSSQVTKAGSSLSSTTEKPPRIDFDKEQLIRENTVLKEENARLREQIQDEKRLKSGWENLAKEREVEIKKLKQTLQSMKQQLNSMQNNIEKLEKDKKILKNTCEQLHSTKSSSWWSSLFK